VVPLPDDLSATTNSDLQRDRVTDVAVDVLPLPHGYWSIFALLNADGPDHVDRGSVSWMRGNIIPAIAGSLADVHNSTHPPPDTDIDDALRQTLARLDTDARTGAPWARQASPTSSLLVFFDSGSRVLRVASAGAGSGRAFLGRRVGNGYECRELAGSGTAQYLLEHDAPSRARDVEELVDGSVFPPSRGALDAALVEVESVEVRDGDFLVLGSHSIWSSLAGDEAVQAVSGCIREQEEEPTAPGRLARGGRWPCDPFLDFPWKKDNHGLGLDWVRTMIPDLIREVDTMFVGARENVASRVLRIANLEHRVECSMCDQDCHPSERLGRPAPNSG